MSDDEKLPPEVEARAIRMRNAVIGQLGNPEVRRVAGTVGEAFAASSEASGLSPLQVLAVAVRMSYASGIYAVMAVKEDADADFEWADLWAFRAAYTSLIDQGIKLVGQDATEGTEH